MKVSYRAKLLLGFVVLCGIIGFFVWKLHQLAEKSEEDSRLVSHTQEVLESLHQVYTTVVEIETGQRGFALTADDRFLEPFHSGRSAIDDHLEHLKILIAKEIAGLGYLETLGVLVRKKTDFASRIVQLVNEGARDTALQEIRAGTGRTSMDQLKEFIATIRSEETRLLEIRRNEAAASGRASAFMLYWTMSLLFGLAILLYFAVRRYPRVLEEANKALESGIKERTASLAALTRLYATLSQVNQAIVRATTRRELFDSICHLAIEHGEFRLAWIGLFDPDTGRVTPVALHGQRQGALPFQEINVKLPPFKEGVIARAIVTNNVTYTSDIQADPQMHHWRTAARDYGYRSVAVVPFRLRGNLIGILSLHAAEANFFDDPKEVRLLEEIGMDISFGLDGLETDAERKVAEKKLGKSEERFRALFESSPDGIIVVNATGEILTINHRSESLFGYTQEELEGKPVETLIPDRFNRHKTFRSEYTSDPQVRPMGKGVQLFAKRRDGTEFPADVALSPIQSGAELNVIATVRDVTEQKRLEEERQKTEEQFRLISENVTDLIAVIDLEGKWLYNSPSYKTVLGDPASLVGTDSFQEIHPEDRERVSSIFQETVTTGVGHRVEYRIVLPDRGIRFIESQGSVIRDEQGDIAWVVAVSRDVTEKKQLEAQFLRAQRMQSIGTLAGGIAHDLNNMLAPILLALGILEKKFTDQESQRILRMLMTSAQRGSDLIRQVLSFSRGIEGERTTMQVRHVIDEVGRIVNETFPKSITFRWSVAKNLPMVLADATQIHQVLMNLCVNARDAMPQGGVLDVRAESVMLDEQYARMHIEANPGLHVIIIVTDQGTGIPSATLERIFEPFFTTKEVGKGTGLGLSTVLAIVKSHGGFVNVYSEVGKGTTFKVYLPAVVIPQEIISPADEEAVPMGNGEAILVVDDEASIREITKTTLEAYGYTVLTASDGTEAVALYAKEGERIALVLTDMMMPYMDGPATIRAIHRINPKARILAVSGLKPNVDSIEGHSVTFLHKPYTAEQLLNTVHQLIHDQPSR